MNRHVALSPDGERLHFSRSRLVLPDGPATLVRAPGAQESQDADTALFKAARWIGDGPVFVMGPGAAASALWAARSGAEVMIWTDSLAEAETITATFKENSCTAPRLYCQADFVGMEPASCGTALVYLPRGRELQAEALRLAAALLRPGGKLVFVGATREGVRTVIKEAREFFGQAGVLAQKGGYHAAIAQRSAEEALLPEVDYRETLVTLEDCDTRVISGPGVFAGDRLDEGAASLIAGMRIEPGAEVLDLGCGTGLVGLAAQRRGAVVTLVDVSQRAVASSRRTFAANGYTDCTACASIGASTVAGRSFDTVVTNPPFHKGHGVDFEVAQLFVGDAARVLRPGGRLYLVANAFLEYGSWLRRHFANSEVVWENTRFRVWEARK